MTAQHGITETGSILDRIVADKLDQLQERKRRAPTTALRQEFEEYALGKPRPISQSIASPPKYAPRFPAVQTIAEIKRASPSRGVLAMDLDPSRIAREYTRSGAAGISIVTERNHFFGDLGWLREVSVLLESEFGSDRPSVLRKDFIVDPYEIVESRAYGADNILLIAALLETSLLRDFIRQTQALGVEALVEVHNEAEAASAMEAGATLYGINNRNLHTFDVDLAVAERIRPLLPVDAVVIGESGVHTRADVDRLRKAGVNAILVGEAFMTADDIAGKMAELRL
jgi:indole-3-glycerol phosphate synthase